MAQADEHHGLVEELTRHCAPLRAPRLRFGSGLDRQAAPTLKLVSGRVGPPSVALDPLQALGAVSAAMETINRQLEAIVGWLGAEEERRPG
jgi:hypothetical protein